MKYSFVIPVFNRPDEVDELLESLTKQSLQDFEVLIVEDGSSQPCQEVAERYADALNVRYFMKENSGPGGSRNYGVERAKGEYVIILDSGENVSPEELENLLAECADIQECIVKEKGKKIGVVVYCDEDKQQQVRDFITEANRTLPLYKRMVPEFSAQPLPRNSAGKLLRQ